MHVSALRIEPSEDNLTYLATADDVTVTLRHLDDETVRKLYYGLEAEPKADEQIKFPAAHLLDVIQALIEIVRKRKAT